jgi:hypothetical protein
MLVTAFLSSKRYIHCRKCEISNSEKRVKAGTRAVIAPIWSEPADHGEMAAELQFSICLAKPFSNKSGPSKMELAVSFS